MAKDSTKIVKYGHYTIKIHHDSDSTTLGYTEKGFEVHIDNDYVEILAHERGTMPLDVICTGSKARCTIESLEVSKANLQELIPLGTFATTTMDLTYDMINKSVKDTRVINIEINRTGDTAETNTLCLYNCISRTEDIALIGRHGEVWKLNFTFETVGKDSDSAAFLTWGTAYSA